MQASLMPFISQRSCRAKCCGPTTGGCCYLERCCAPAALVAYMPHIIASSWAIFQWPSWPTLPTGRGRWRRVAATLRAAGPPESAAPTERCNAPLPHRVRDDRCPFGRRAVQLQPLGGQRAERLLLVIPGLDDFVDDQRARADPGTDVVMLPPVRLELAHQRPGLPRHGHRQETVAPAVAGRSKTARHPLGPEHFEALRQ